MDAVLEEYKEGVITLSDIKEMIIEDESYEVVLAMIIDGILRGNDGEFESYETYTVISDVLDVASGVKASISIFTSVICQGSEEMIRLSLNTYLRDYGYLDTDEYGNDLLYIEEPLIAFLERGSMCDRLNVVYRVVAGVDRFRSSDLLAYYLMMYDEIDQSVARRILSSTNSKYVLSRMGFLGSIGMGSFDIALERLNRLKYKEDV